jgi:hypothetical protein
VFILQEEERKPARAGQPLGTGQGVLTEGSESGAAMRLPDGTRIVLGADTLVRGIVERPKGGKTVTIEAGRLEAEVVPRPADRPLVFVTPQAEARVVGTHLALAVTAESTRLDVGEGRVRFMRRKDRKSVDVTAGHYAMMTIDVTAQVRVYDKSNLSPEWVNPAIDKGAQWLLKQKLVPEAKSGHQYRNHELVLYTLLHAKVDLRHPVFQKWLHEIMKEKLELTYSVVLHAMLLQELDATRYQRRIAYCGQYLLDNLCKNGQWSYGSPAPSGGIATSGGSSIFGFKMKLGPPLKPKNQIRLRVRKTGPATGDNSNSQYAALGLRACMEANVILPKEVFVQAAGWWKKNQNEDGGWGYGSGNTASYGSMTAGGVASLIILHHYGGLGVKAPCIQRGLKWMEGNFQVNTNPVRDAFWQYYYLYALERVGMLGLYEKIGPHAWYPIGANYLLKQQKPDGSWVNATKYSEGNRIVWDTCFAILFLSRATMPVATESHW